MIDASWPLAPAALLLVFSACGGGSGSPGDPAPSSPPPAPSGPESGYIRLSSDEGDYIGRGEEYRYTKADAEITFIADAATLTIAVEGDEHWLGQFRLPETYELLQPGSYPDLQRFGFHDPAVGGLEWSGEGRGCNGLTAWLIIDSVTYEEQDLADIDLQFEQHCEGRAAALHGEIHWYADDPTSPPGPVMPVPTGLWEPSAGTTPWTGNYVYLDSEPGDYIGAGWEYLYTEADSSITVNATDGHLSIVVSGSEEWYGDFEAMNTLGRLEAGYYAELQRYPFHNPVKGGLNWWGRGSGCNRLTGWFAVDRVTYEGSVMTAIDLRFAQHCEGAEAALHGEIHWGL